MDFVLFLWNEVIIRPMINSLVVIYAFLFHNFGLSIVIFTLLIRLLTVPLTLRQLRQTKGMSELQPKLQELQKRHAKDKQKLSQETMRLYKEQGINPIGCLGPLVIQFPIWIGLYQALINALPSTPESLVSLSQRLYSWLPLAHQVIPLGSQFVWLDLATPDPTPVLPLLVGASMWVQQKMTTFPSADPKQQQTNQILLWMMPIMFVFFTFQFPSGLALYWVVSNIAGIAIQYFVTGWGGLLPKRRPAAEPADAPAQPAKEQTEDGTRGSDREDRGRGRRAGAKAARRKAGRGGDRGPQQR
ncbi:MAG: membrane protein insertase YidC [Chloroflexi bacterium]|nr:membrane protein insertase YidC [Chloroflexota bacterium]